MLDEKFQRNTSNFIIFYVYKNTKLILLFFNKTIGLDLLSYDEGLIFFKHTICTLQLPIFIYERTEKYTQEATAHQVPHYLRPNNNIKVYRPTTTYYTLTTWKITLTVQVLKNPSSSKYPRSPECQLAH